MKIELITGEAEITYISNEHEYYSIVAEGFDPTFSIQIIPETFNDIIISLESIYIEGGDGFTLNIFSSSNGIDRDNLKITRTFTGGQIARFNSRIAVDNFYLILEFFPITTHIGNAYYSIKFKLKEL